MLCLLRRMTSTSSSYAGQDAVARHLRKASVQGCAPLWHLLPALLPCTLR